MWSAAEGDAVVLSLIVGLLATACVLPPAVFLAYRMARARFRGKALVETLLLLPLVLPPVVTGFLLLLLVGPRRGVLGPALRSLGIEVLFTWKAAVLASAIVAFPLAYRACRVAFEQVDPRLVGLARTLGAGGLDAFFSVTLPLARRGVVAAALLAFVRSVGEFGATMVVAGNVAGETRTLPLLVYTELQRPDGLDAVWRLSLLAVALGFVALFAIERFVRGDVR